MNCPKCGFVQEERVDCIKCGVVFAKFYAFRAPDAGPPPATPEPPGRGAGFVEEAHIPELADLFEVRQGLRDLQQRFNDLEFERAERRQIRTDIRALETRLQEQLARIASRQEELDKRVGALASVPAPPTMQDLDALRAEVRVINLKPLRKSIERIESLMLSHSEKLGTVTDSGALTLLPALEGRVSALEGRLADLADRPRETHPNPEGAQLDELKTSLQKVTVRYAEIGELKKNHLVLRDMIETLRTSVEGFRNETVSRNSARIGELEKEVLALRAEVRKAYECMESLESMSQQTAQVPEPDPLKEILSLKEELAAAGRIREAEQDRIQSEVGALRSKVSETLQTLNSLPETLKSFSSQIRRLDQQYQPLTEGLAEVSGAINETPQKIEGLSHELATLRENLAHLQERVQALQEKLDSRPAPATDDVPQGQADMSLIRDNLNEIRRFMTSLSQKLQ